MAGRNLEVYMFSQRAKKNKSLLEAKDYFVLSRKELNIVQKVTERSRRNFGESLKDADKTDIGLIACIVYVLLKQLEDYYNNDICMSTSIATILLKKKQLRKEVKAYFAENAIFRLITFWDYYYLVINEYLQLGFVADNQVRQSLIQKACMATQFVRTDKGYSLVQVPLKPEKQSEIKRDLKITVLSKEKLKRKLTRDFALTERFVGIIKLMDSDCIEDLKTIRHQVIHRRSLGAGFSVDVDMIFGQTLQSKPGGWTDFNNLSKIIEENLRTVGNALEVLHQVIQLDERPNSKGNENIEYFVYHTVCEKCGNENILPGSIFSNPDIVLCQSCWSRGLKILQKIKSNEINHGERMFHYLQDFQKHVDSLLNECE